ncbi:hypothetical protein [Staphylococcus xylosus]
MADVRLEIKDITGEVYTKDFDSKKREVYEIRNKYESDIKNKEFIPVNGIRIRTKYIVCFNVVNIRNVE